MKSCKDCVNRYIGCHSECELYINEKNEYNRQQAEIHKYKTTQLMLNRVRTNAINNFRKGRGKKK